MLPSFLITIREVIEATLIVATLLGILVKLNQKKGVKTVLLATASAFGVSIILLLLGSLLGFEIQKLYTGKVEQITEGTLMVLSALFITWAVFFLHKYFSSHKVKLLQKVKETMEKEEQRGLFMLTFTAVLREGFEIVLFLSTVYFSSSPAHIAVGFLGGLLGGIIISFALFSATLKMPVYWTFRITSMLLILFAAGLLARGVHELTEGGLIPEIENFTLSFIPSQSSFAGQTVNSVLGISQHMNILQVALYSLYSSVMVWWVFLRKKSTIQAE